MNDKISKILNGMLLMMISSLILTLILPRTQNTQSEGIYLKAEKTTYTVPASPVLIVTNNTSSGINFNTCENISINFNGKKLDLGENFCKDVEIGAKNTYRIELSDYYKSFLEKGDYYFNLTLNNESLTFTEKIKIKNKMLISKLFVGLIYAPLYNLTIFFIQLFNNSLGWAIITVTVIIRLFLLYPQHKSLASQKKLNNIQPKIKELQEKYKNDKQQLGLEMMNLYKKEKINPLGSCGLLLVQLPIIWVIYNIFRFINDYSNTYYLYSVNSDFKLNTVNSDFYGLDLLASGGIVGICLGITIALLQFTQAKLSLARTQKNTKKDKVVLEKSKKKDEYTPISFDPNIMNKFILYVLPIMVGFFAYGLMAGIGVYWGITTIFSIVQQLIVNKILKK